METRFSPIQIRPSWLRKQVGRLSRYAQKANRGLDKVGSWLFPNPEALLGYKPVMIDGPAANILLMESKDLSGTSEKPSDEPEDLVKLKDEIVNALREKRGYTPEELQVLEQSFDFMIRFFGNETLPSGDKIAVLLMGVARSLAEWGCDPVVVSAGLLHLAPVEDLQEGNIDQHVIYLVHRMNVLEKYLFVPLRIDKLSEREAYHLTQMCLMHEGDRNVWLLQAAADFRTLSTSSETDNRSKRLASRSYHVTSRIIGLFDLDDIAVKLENVAFMRLDKEEYERVEGIIEDANKRDRIKALEHLRLLTDLISIELNEKKIKHRVELDVKSVTRTMKKLEKGERLTDASRFRFIVDGSREQCVEAMRIIEKEMNGYGHYEDRSERKNYIDGITLGNEYDLGPKENGYESIHMHFLGTQFEPINVQIRTEEMHEAAEVGQASHGRFKYKLNGLMPDTVVPEASVERQKLVESGTRYGIYDGEIYELVPYPPGRKIKLIDLLVAISNRYVSRAPYSVLVRRIDPETGQAHEMRLHPKNAPLENGDQISSLPITKKPRLIRIGWGDLSTLPGQVAYKLAGKGQLDPLTIDQTSSRVALRGKRALDDKLLAFKRELRDRMIAILKGDGENLGLLDIWTPISIDLAADRLGAAGPEELYLKAGFIRRQENFVDNVVSMVQSSSSVAALKIIEETGHADLWLLYPESLGALPAVLSLLKNRFRKLVRMSCRPLKGYVLIKARIKGRKRSIEEDAVAFLTETNDLHKSSRHLPKEGRQTKIRMEWRLGRLDIDKISRVAEILQGVGANIISANFPQPYEGRVTCNLTVEVPLGKSEAFQNRMGRELKKAGITGLSIV